MHIRKDDMVVVKTGDDKGPDPRKVLRALPPLGGLKTDATRAPNTMMIRAVPPLKAINPRTHAFTRRHVAIFLIVVPRCM